MWRGDAAILRGKKWRKEHTIDRQYLTIVSLQAPVLEEGAGLCESHHVGLAPVIGRRHRGVVRAPRSHLAWRRSIRVTAVRSVTSRILASFWRWRRLR